MPSYTTETRTYIGEPMTAVRDGYASFRLGQQYQLTINRRLDGMVAIVFNHIAYEKTGGGAMVVSEVEFEKWFRK